ncbi:hypothetical protein [Thermococcus sp. JCM 11816]|uniref:hypothetical protein n=1 Tax=Thermococcus sp. (strain JCM 11816 / KS-1) TaxID=1295125 RepID=UPI0006D0F642
MDVIMALAAVVFIGFAARTLYLLLREERKKDLLLTTAMWGLALVVWGGLYLITVRGEDPPGSLCGGCVWFDRVCAFVHRFVQAS